MYSPHPSSSWFCKPKLLAPPAFSPSDWRNLFSRQLFQNTSAALLSTDSSFSSYVLRCRDQAPHTIQDLKPLQGFKQQQSKAFILIHTEAHLLGWTYSVSWGSCMPSSIPLLYLRQLFLFVPLLRSPFGLRVHSLIPLHMD